MINCTKMEKQQSAKHPSHEVFNPNIIIVERPRPTDVLCGRGKICFEHKGNDSFRMLIAQHVDSYENSASKKAKMDVIMQVVDTVITRGGRFLVRDKEKAGGVWIDGGVKQGKKKTGHALRDALRGRVKCISEMRANYKPARMPSFEEQSSCAASFSSDEKKVNRSHQDHTKHDRVAMKLEPERQWRRNSELDKEFKEDLLQFFKSNSTDTKEQLPNLVLSPNTQATLSKKKKKEKVKLEPEK
eukprot:CAMPEP_0194242946 /NCGR_PEP_ID=MMETSP0158-20130606/8326_1 /TAXON_ID=33649 /ORGANISM="Thalassionema nitzschioides, Strain L26-B" /LENGTH=242 /DNA_ID=CAMNT_0038978133 /DNA_START=137 /DNA_END=865 /DNA_ORIENTATION=-